VVAPDGTSVKRPGKLTLAVSLVCAGLLAACAEPSEPAPEAKEAAPATAPAEAEASPARRGPRVSLRASQFGPVLFGGRARALYRFTRDNGRRSRCYGDCAVAWPPFIARGRPRAGEGVRQSLLGTVRRRNGARQVTYRGQPLYFYVDDPRGEVLCNDVTEFGGVWYALDAKGRPPA
jgi:predicted lipoprotein with Yx(FWY)xxD motif